MSKRYMIHSILKVEHVVKDITVDVCGFKYNGCMAATTWSHVGIPLEVTEIQAAPVLESNDNPDCDNYLMETTSSGKIAQLVKLFQVATSRSSSRFPESSLARPTSAAAAR